MPDTSSGGKKPLTILAPATGLSGGSDLGGAVVERELLMAMSRAGAKIIIPNLMGVNIPAEGGVVAPRIRGGRLWLRNLSWRDRGLMIGSIYHALRHAPDIIRIPNAVWAGNTGLMLRRLFRLPVACQFYHHYPGEQGEEAFKKEKRVLNRCDGIVTTSRFSARQLIDLYRIPPRKILISPCGVNPGCFAMSRRPAVTASGPRPKILLFVGRLIPRKNVEFLLDVMPRILAKVGSAVLYLVGGANGGEDHAGKLLDKTRSLNLQDHVRFFGHLPEDRKIRLMRESDVFVFPSLLEGFGMAVAEAMAAGIPVVAFKSGALPEVVEEGKTGLLVEPGDHDAFISAVADILTDDELCHRLGDVGQKAAREKFNWDRAAKLQLEWFRTLAN